MELPEIIAKARVMLIRKLDFWSDEEKRALIAEPDPDKWEQALEAIPLAERQEKR
jgi:hypothetical protein